MNSQHLIAKAERALRTGQPNLAMLYMAKALTAVGEERRLIQREVEAVHMRRISQLIRFGLIRSFEELSFAISPFVKMFSSIGKQ